MSLGSETLAERLRERFGNKLRSCGRSGNRAMIEVPKQDMTAVFTALRDEAEFAFEQLIDVCGMDYLAYGQDEWMTDESTSLGFSRGVTREPPKPGERQGPRFAAVYQLLSLKHNHRVQVRVYCEDDEFPVLDSVTVIWPAANWFEREAFDLFGILFEGHPDLRRILTDYGFVGHPFRKDFPLIGNVEVRYDPDRERVVYQPVSIEPRTLVPKVIRPEEHERANIGEQRGGATDA